jgi:hypothetical protein
MHALLNDNANLIVPNSPIGCLARRTAVKLPSRVSVARGGGWDRGCRTTTGLGLKLIRCNSSSSLRPTRTMGRSEPMGKLPIHPFLAGQPRTAPLASWADVAPRSEPVATSRYSRRLSDKIIIAFHDACDRGELVVAAQFRPRAPGDRRRNTESIVAAHSRLWPLRHPEPADHRGQPTMRSALR